jgi:hypothetical protein
MKRLIIYILALMLTGPVVAHAQQNDDQDRRGPTEYRDVEDGQLLKLVSYILTPVGMALEWGVMRPLHYLATQTSAAPLLSGDKGSPYFTENTNANQVPPGTFAPYTINPTNTLHASNSDTTLVPVAPAGSTLAPAKTIPPSKPPLLSGNQSALH